jgi:hypothetical protein
MSTMSTFVLTDDLTVVCFEREDCDYGPLFAVREFDSKIIRSPQKQKKGSVRTGVQSEQAIRASIRQAILSLKLRAVRKPTVGPRTAS